MENPKYLLIPLILSLGFVFVLWYLFPNWSIYQYITIAIASFPGFLLVVAQILAYWKETIEEKGYETILEKPFKQKFIIPSIKWMKINYHQQTNEPQRKDEINISANTTVTIIIRTNTELDLEVRDSQYSFGGKKNKKKPEIIKYKNPYYTKQTSKTKWYDDDPFDWHDIYHLKGKRLMFKDVTYIDGFEIKTHDKGKFSFNMEFIVVCKKYKSLEKEKSANVRTNLKVNVI